jgi:hypothetical protein
MKRFLVLLTLATSALAQTAPPAGFTTLFNGKDLAGFRGGDTFDHRKLLAMPEAERAAQIAKWTETMKAHWRAENGELVNDGQGAYATTEKDYGDFELLIEFKTVAARRLGHLPPRRAAGADLGFHGKGEGQSRRGQGFGRTLEQLAGRAGEGSTGPGGQAIRRMEQVPHRHGRLAGERLAE